MALFGQSEAAGVYFPMETLFLPEAYERPLNETDLLELDAEKLRLLRNQYFAVYGREFENQELQKYFEQQPWYEKAENAEQMAEANFTELDKRNIEFIKKAEKEFDFQKWEQVQKEYEQLPQAPYKELLPEHMEIGIDGREMVVPAGTQVRLTPGESITIYPYLYHDFEVEEGSGPVLLGEVSQCNDDNTDNRFYEPVGRFPAIEEDEAPYRLLCNEYPQAKDEV